MTPGCICRYHHRYSQWHVVLLSAKQCNQWHFLSSLRKYCCVRVLTVERPYNQCQCVVRYRWHLVALLRYGRKAIAQSVLNFVVWVMPQRLPPFNSQVIKSKKRNRKPVLARLTYGSDKPPGTNLSPFVPKDSYHCITSCVGDSGDV